MNLNEANKKFIKGDALSDDELDLLLIQYRSVLVFFKAIAESQFNLFEHEIVWRFGKLRDFKQEREDNDQENPTRIKQTNL